MYPNADALIEYPLSCVTHFSIETFARIELVFDIPAYLDLFCIVF